jgi:hypothetical protein
MFPEAKFIHIHRNPVEVFLSTRQFFTHMLPHLTLQRMGNKEIEDLIFPLYKNLMGDYFDQKDCIPQGNLIEVSFNQLEENPLQVLNKIYGELNLPNFERALPNFTKYLAGIKQYKKNSHRIERGLLNRIQTEWSHFMVALNYEIPDSIETIDG